MKKIIDFSYILLFSILIFTLTSCDMFHKHVYDEWIKTVDYHFHYCTDCKERVDKARHNWVLKQKRTQTYKCSVCQAERTASEGFIFDLTASGKEYTLRRIWGCNESFVIIPAKYNGLPVVGIEDSAILGDKNIEYLIIPSTIKYISERAFYKCPNLKKVEILEGLETIAGGAFSECTNLTIVNIPRSVTEIGEGAFNECSALKKIVIPKTVTQIGAYAFAECSKLKIYCEAEKCPSGFDAEWNVSNLKVVWGYKG